MDYPLNHFAIYTAQVIAVMKQRGYKVNTARFWGWMGATDWIPASRDGRELFADWHNDRYLRQCLLNLQEKFDCGGIPADEWQRICERFEDYMEE